MPRYLLGIDFGTERCRVGIFEPDGTAIVVASTGYDRTHPRPGWAEQNPDEWWSALVTSCNRAIDESGISPDAVAGVSVDATSATVLAMDAKDRHMRPASMWMDVRASEEARRIEQTGHAALKYKGYGAVSAEWGLPKVMWRKEHEPDTSNGATRIVDCGDWVVNTLTGEWAGSVNMAAAEQLGLRAGIPVAQGAIDASTGALARGMMWGLTLSPTPAHIFRAILEGICFGTENIFRAMRDDGFRPTETFVAGGPTKGACGCSCTRTSPTGRCRSPRMAGCPPCSARRSWPPWGLASIPTASRLRVRWSRSSLTRRPTSSTGSPSTGTARPITR